jgi:hypothetical protein
MATIQPAHESGGHLVLAPETKLITIRGNTKPKRPTAWQVKGVGGFVGSDVGVAWHPIVQSGDSPNAFAVLFAVLCGFVAAFLVAGIAGAAVPRVAGATVKITVGLAGFVVGGGGFFFAITAGADILGHWMSPLAAIWTSLMVIFVVVVIAVGWLKEA